MEIKDLRKNIIKDTYGDLDNLIENVKWVEINHPFAIDSSFMKIEAFLPKEKVKIKPSSKIQHLHKITFNVKTRKTNVIFKNEKDEYKVFSVKANEKDYKFFGTKGLGFMLAFIKSQVDDNEFRTLTNAVFGYGIDNIEEFLGGYAVRFFDSFSQMIKILDAIQYEKTQVNIKDRIILIEYKKEKE